MTIDLHNYFSIRVAGLPAGVLGENYAVITTSLESNVKGRWEYFLLSNRTSPQLFAESCSFEGNEDQGVFIDTEFLLGDAEMRIESFVSSRLEQLAAEHSRPNIVAYPFHMQRLSSKPLHSLWFRGEMHDEINQIAKATKCPPLKLYLELLIKSSFICLPGGA